MPARATGVLLETLVVAVLGAAFALAANFLSPHGLSLNRDYFPGRHLPRANPPVTTAAPGTNDASARGPEAAALAVLADRLRAEGLHPIAGEEALQFFRDPLYSQRLIVFVDARDEAHYQAGHVPGAYPFDRYYPDKYLPVVLPACGNALKIVVYCTGGKCEDSEFAASTLKEAGTPPEKLFVYTGGITDWTAHGWPLETGERNSGSVRGALP